MCKSHRHIGQLRSDVVSVQMELIASGAGSRPGRELRERLLQRVVQRRRARELDELQRAQHDAAAGRDDEDALAALVQPAREREELADRRRVELGLRADEAHARQIARARAGPGRPMYA